MLQAIEVIIVPGGTIRPLDEFHVTVPTRAVLTLLPTTTSPSVEPGGQRLFVAHRFAGFRGMVRVGRRWSRLPTLPGFESPVRYVERIVGNTSDSIILEGMEFGPEDSNCCPSIKVRFTLRADKKGNWKLAEKKTMPANK